MTTRIPTPTHRYGAAGLAAAALILAACSREAPPPEPERLVKTVVVGEAGADGGRVYSGEVRARYETLLGFRIGGKIATRLVDAGAVVRAGQPLARLDGSDAALQVVQAEAQRSLAEAELKRYRELREKNFISQSALDGKETVFKADAAQAALARNQSSYTTLTADKDGVIAAVLAEAGQVVASGQGVMRLAHKGEREVAINIPEDAVAGLKVGAPAQVNLWADGQRVFQGRLRELSPAADPATRTYPARIALPASEGELPLGLSATVRLGGAAGGDKSGRFAIPLGAVFQQGNKPAVWVVAKDGSLSLRQVAVSRYGDEDAIVDSGLAAGEEIVAAGVHKLNAGDKIKTVRAAQARERQ